MWTEFCSRRNHGFRFYWFCEDPENPWWKRDNANAESWLRHRRRILGVFRAWLICECRFRELKFIRKFSNFVESLEILHIEHIFLPIQKIFIFRDFTSSQSRIDQFSLVILVEYWGNTHVFWARALPLKRSSITQNEYFFDRSKPTFSMDNLWTLH